MLSWANGKKAVKKLWTSRLDLTVPVLYEDPQYGLGTSGAVFNSTNADWLKTAKKVI